MVSPKIRVVQAADWWADRLWLDWVVAALLVTAHVLVVHVAHRGDVLAWLDLASRRGLYSAGAGVAALLATVNSLGVGLYTASAGERMKLVRQVRAQQMRRTWLGLITTPYVASGIALVCLALDHTNGDGGGVHFAFEFAFLLGGLRLSRAVRLYDLLLRVNDADAVAQEKVDTTFS